MKILIVSQYFWPESFKINDLAKSLNASGHDVTVLTGLPNYPSGRWFDNYDLGSIGHEEWDGVDIKRVPIFPRMQGRSWQLVFNYISFVLSASLLGPILIREKIDVVFTYEPSPFTVGIPAIIMKWIKKAPMIFWVQDLWPESLTSTGAIKSKSILYFVGKMVRWIYKHCDLVLVQSEAFIKPAIQAGAKADSIEYFPNWAEEIYKPLKLSKQNQIYDLLPKGFVVMFAGNLGEAQSLQTIISAANRLKSIQDIHWVLIGDGRKLEWMKNRIKDLGLSGCVHFLGRHPTHKMPEFFSTADLLLATLKNQPAFTHTIPSKIQTYMACAKPIVVALNGEGARIINESGSGIAVDAEDDLALSEAILEIYNKTDSERQSIGNTALRYYKENYERDSLINKLQRILKKMIDYNQ